MTQLRWIRSKESERVGLFLGTKKIAQISLNAACPKDVVDRRYIGMMLLPETNQQRLFAEIALELKEPLTILVNEWLKQAGINLGETNEQTS